MAKKPATVVSAEAAALDEDEELDEVAPQLQQAAPPPPKAGGRAPKTTPEIKMPGHQGIRTMKILLEENPDIPPTGQFIGHNGNSYMLRPGIWTMVPMPIIEILNNAVQKVPERDPVTNQIIGWREKLRFPYRVAPGEMAA